MSVSAACLDEAKVNALRSEFAIHGADGSRELSRCDEGSLSYALLRTLLFLRELPPLVEPASAFNQNLLPARPSVFFAERVQEIVLDDQPRSEHCPDERLAYLPQESRTEKRIWICAAFRNGGLVTQASALVHEARHQEGEQWHHHPCRGGPYDGRLSCDQAYRDGGSYAVGLEFLVKLAHAPTLAPELRAEARRAAIMDFLSRFREAPLPSASGALLQREGAEELSFYDGETELPLPMRAPSDSIWAVQGGLPLFFSPAKGTVGLYAYENEPRAPVSDVLTRRFTRELSAAERATLRDVFYGDQYACLLLAGSVDCYAPDRHFFRQPLPGIDPQHFLYSNRSRVLEPGHVALLTTGGARYRLPFSAEGLAQESLSTWDSQPGPFGLRTIQPWAYGEIALGLAGELVRLDHRRADWHEALPAARFHAVLAPFTYAPALNDL